MPPPIKVQLSTHNPDWLETAKKESRLVAEAIGNNLIDIHHIGSTAVPGIAAKPIIDLMPVLRDLLVLDQHQKSFEALGYGWRGEYGIPGRRYCSKNDPRTGRRLFQLHCYQEGSPDIVRHLAFRDALRSDAALAKDYEAKKVRCQALHPNDSHAYSECKSDWIRRVESDALRPRND